MVAEPVQGDKWDEGEGIDLYSFWIKATPWQPSPTFRGEAEPTEHVQQRCLSSPTVAQQGGDLTLINV